MSNKRYKHVRKGFRLTKAKLLGFGGLLFSFGVVTSVTTTYAYYSLTRIASISNINLFINMDDSLDLYLAKENREYDVAEFTAGSDSLVHSENGFSWEDLTYFTKNNILSNSSDEIRLNDVSGMFESEWLEDTTIANATKLPKVHTAFRSWDSEHYRNPGYKKDRDVYFQNIFYIKTNMPATIYLDGELDENNEPLTSIVPNLERNAEAAESSGRNIETLNEVTKAVRVSFYTVDDQDQQHYVVSYPGKEVKEDVYFAGRLDLNGDGYWDVDGDNNEIFYGEYKGNVIREFNSNTDLPYENGDTFHANSKPGANVVKAMNQQTNLIRAKEKAIPLDKLCYESGKPYKEVQPLCTVKAGEYKRIVMTIYVEGWDYAMTDAIANASFNISLSFLALFDQ